MQICRNKYLFYSTKPKKNSLNILGLLCRIEKVLIYDSRMQFFDFFAIFAIDNLHTIEVSRCAELKMKKKCILSVSSDIYIDLLAHTKGLKTNEIKTNNILITSPIADLLWV